MLKINRQPEFFKKLKSLSVEDGPKNPLKDPSFPHFKEKSERSVIQGWYSQAPGLLFHACKPCILKLLEISAVANHSDVREILSRTCYFVNSQWLTSEKNCFEKIYFRLISKAGGRDLEVCSQCQINLCLSVIYKEFNCLNKSYVLA